MNDEQYREIIGRLQRIEEKLDASAKKPRSRRAKAPPAQDAVTPVGVIVGNRESNVESVPDEEEPVDIAPRRE